MTNVLVHVQDVNVHTRVHVRVSVVAECYNECLQQIGSYVQQNVQPFDESYNPLNATRTTSQIGANTNDNSTLLRDDVASDASQEHSSQAACRMMVSAASAKFC